MIKKKCALPYCRNKIPARQKGAYCEVHKSKGQKQLYETDKKYIAFYQSLAWKNVRKVVLAESFGLCIDCFKQGSYRKADVVHHVYPIKTKKGWERRLEKKHLKPLCHAHHNLIHDEKGGYKL